MLFRKLVPYDDWSNLMIHVAMDNTVVIDDICEIKLIHFMLIIDILRFYLCADFLSSVFSVSMTLTMAKNSIGNTKKSSNQKNSNDWKPLLLMIPLRLGLNDINPIYIPALKKCFEIEENCGMIGGRPNQALYFIGYVGDEVLYLDPHTTQRSGSVGEKTSEDEIEFDTTFHQKYAGRIPFTGMDPSLAIVN